MLDLIFYWFLVFSINSSEWKPKMFNLVENQLPIFSMKNNWKQTIPYVFVTMPTQLIKLKKYLVLFFIMSTLLKKLIL